MSQGDDDDAPEDLGEGVTLDGQEVFLHGQSMGWLDDDIETLFDALRARGVEPPPGLLNALWTLPLLVDDPNPDA